MNDELEGNTNKLTPQQKSHQHEIENAVLVLAAEVVRCDKNLSSTKEAYITGFLNRQFGSHSTAYRVKTIAGHVESGTEPFVKIACKQLKLLTTPSSRLSIVQFLFGVAAADDFLNAKEIRTIHRIAGYLGISDNDFKEVKQSYLSIHSPYHVLGLDEKATYDEVKAAYRKMVLRFHPDKRSNEQSEEEASLKFREIKRAFEIITKEKGNIE